MKIINTPFILFIKGYQKLISPILGNHCRFYPSCSQYALESFTEHNVVKAFFKTVWRILRCAPWSKGGFDPVLPKKHTTTIGE